MMMEQVVTQLQQEVFTLKSCSRDSQVRKDTLSLTNEEGLGLSKGIHWL